MRGRQIRLVVSLVVASLLASVFLYTALGDKTRVLQVAQVKANPTQASSTVRLNGTVVSHTGDAHGPSGMRFVLADNEARSAGCVTVLYHGQVPDAFRNGRAILVDGKLAAGGTFMAERGSLSTKCPSKYDARATGQPLATCV